MNVLNLHSFECYNVTNLIYRVIKVEENRIRYLRNQIGLTQKQLAEKVGVTMSVISYYELRERCPSPDILKKLAYVFHVSTDYLLGIDDKRMLDVSELDEEEVQLITKMIDTFENKKRL